MPSFLPDWMDSAGSSLLRPRTVDLPAGLAAYHDTYTRVYRHLSLDICVFIYIYIYLYACYCVSAYVYTCCVTIFSLKKSDLFVKENKTARV